MSWNKFARAAVALVMVAVFGLAPFISAQKKDDKKKADEKLTAAAAQGSPVLWRDPGDISALDLSQLAPADADKPDLSKITYLRDEQTGYSVKYHVKDGAG